MSLDSGTEHCGLGTRSPEWETHNTADLMIGMCTAVCAVITCVILVVPCWW